MYYLKDSINENGEDIEYIRETYRHIYSDLLNSWEQDNPDDKEDKEDFHKILKMQWKEYAAYEDEEIKKMLKI